MEMMRQNTPELVSELSSLRIPRVIHNISKIIMVMNIYIYIYLYIYIYIYHESQHVTNL